MSSSDSYIAEFPSSVVHSFSTDKDASSVESPVINEREKNAPTKEKTLDMLLNAFKDQSDEDEFFEIKNSSEEKEHTRSTTDRLEKVTVDRKNSDSIIENSFQKPKTSFTEQYEKSLNSVLTIKNDFCIELSRAASQRIIESVIFLGQFITNYLNYEQGTDFSPKGNSELLETMGAMVFALNVTKGIATFFESSEEVSQISMLLDKFLIPDMSIPSKLSESSEGSFFSVFPSESDSTAIFISSFTSDNEDDQACREAIFDKFSEQLMLNQKRQQQEQLHSISAHHIIEEEKGLSVIFKRFQKSLDVENTLLRIHEYIAREPLLKRDYSLFSLNFSKNKTISSDFLFSILTKFMDPEISKRHAKDHPEFELFFEPTVSPTIWQKEERLKGKIFRSFEKVCSLLFTDKPYVNELQAANAVTLFFQKVKNAENYVKKQQRKKTAKRKGNPKSHISTREHHETRTAKHFEKPGRSQPFSSRARKRGTTKKKSHHRTKSLAFPLITEDYKITPEESALLPFMIGIFFGPYSNLSPSNRLSVSNIHVYLCCMRELVPKNDFALSLLATFDLAYLAEHEILNTLGHRNPHKNPLISNNLRLLQYKLVTDFLLIASKNIANAIINEIHWKLSKEDGRSQEMVVDIETSFREFESQRTPLAAKKLLSLLKETFSTSFSSLFDPLTFSGFGACTVVASIAYPLFFAFSLDEGFTPLSATSFVKEVDERGDSDIFSTTGFSSEDIDDTTGLLSSQPELGRGFESDNPSRNEFSGFRFSDLDDEVESSSLFYWKVLYPNISHFLPSKPLSRGSTRKKDITSIHPITIKKRADTQSEIIRSSSEEKSKTREQTSPGHVKSSCLHSDGTYYSETIPQPENSRSEFQMKLSCHSGVVDGVKESVPKTIHHEPILTAILDSKKVAIEFLQVTYASLPWFAFAKARMGYNIALNSNDSDVRLSAFIESLLLILRGHITNISNFLHPNNLSFTHIFFKDFLADLEESDDKNLLFGVWDTFHKIIDLSVKRDETFSQQVERTTITISIERDALSKEKEFPQRVYTLHDQIKQLQKSANFSICIRQPVRAYHYFTRALSLGEKAKSMLTLDFFSSFINVCENLGLFEKALEIIELAILVIPKPSHSIPSEKGSVSSTPTSRTDFPTESLSYAAFLSTSQSSSINSSISRLHLQLLEVKILMRMGEIRKAFFLLEKINAEHDLKENVFRFRELLARCQLCGPPALLEGFEENIKELVDFLSPELSATFCTSPILTNLRFVSLHKLCSSYYTKIDRHDVALKFLEAVFALSSIISASVIAEIQYKKAKILSNMIGIRCKASFPLPINLKVELQANEVGYELSNYWEGFIKFPEPIQTRPQLFGEAIAAMKDSRERLASVGNFSLESKAAARLAELYCEAQFISVHLTGQPPLKKLEIPKTPMGAESICIDISHKQGTHSLRKTIRSSTAPIFRSSKTKLGKSTFRETYTQQITPQMCLHNAYAACDLLFAGVHSPLDALHSLLTISETYVLLRNNKAALSYLTHISSRFSSYILNGNEFSPYIMELSLPFIKKVREVLVRIIRLTLAFDGLLHTKYLPFLDALLTLDLQISNANRQTEWPPESRKIVPSFSNEKLKNISESSGNIVPPIAWLVSSLMPYTLMKGPKIAPSKAFSMKKAKELFIGLWFSNKRHIGLYSGFNRTEKVALFHNNCLISAMNNLFSETQKHALEWVVADYRKILQTFGTAQVYYKDAFARITQDPVPSPCIVVFSLGSFHVLLDPAAGRQLCVPVCSSAKMQKGMAHFKFSEELDKFHGKNLKKQEEIDLTKLSEIEFNIRTPSACPSAAVTREFGEYIVCLLTEFRKVAGCPFLPKELAWKGVWDISALFAHPSLTAFHELGDDSKQGLLVPDVESAIRNSEHELFVVWKDFLRQFEVEISRVALDIGMEQSKKGSSDKMVQLQNMCSVYLRKYFQEITLVVHSSLSFLPFELFMGSRAVTRYINLFTFLDSHRAAGGTAHSAPPSPQILPTLPNYHTFVLTSQARSIVPAHMEAIKTAVSVLHSTRTIGPALGNSLRVSRIRESHKGAAPPLTSDLFLFKNSRSARIRRQLRHLSISSSSELIGTGSLRILRILEATPLHLPDSVRRVFDTRPGASAPFFGFSVCILSLNELVLPSDLLLTLVSSAPGCALVFAPFCLHDRICKLLYRVQVLCYKSLEALAKKQRKYIAFEPPALPLLLQYPRRFLQSILFAVEHDSGLPVILANPPRR
eukprot:gnl/Chilomastix_cuspidata/4905.p1 GENE.gnl/Chilomastix_cuspidata/4905~~gnl/Chilomastix_cuspidata/4905.p1  ORF type:complete len:2274 (+),score=238.18 gnl/Chilomastix_cuspidata/4905:89-6823(+)